MAPTTRIRTLDPAPGYGANGYSLVVLIIAVTVMNILVAASLPLWSSAIRRDKEEELIFRGLQYAEAIRVFNNKHGRFPVRLEELVEVEPRAIRHLWKDPMTEDGKWQLIFDTPGGGAVQLPPPGGGDPAVRGPGEDEEGEENNGREEEEEGGGIGGPKKGDVVAAGPIIGVRSRSRKASFITFNGKQRYDEWQFTKTLLDRLMAGQGGTAPPQGGFDETMIGKGMGPPDLSTRWLGRPLPPYLTQGQPQDGSLPNDPSQLGPGSRRSAGGKPQPGGTQRR